MNKKKNATCGNCTLKLVTISYKRTPLIRIVREPLKLGMRMLSKIHHVNPTEYEVRTPRCYNCVRFYKVALNEKSVTFRFLHKFLNPTFNYLIGKIVTEEERKRAREYASAASEGKIGEEESKIWMNNMKVGF